MSYLLDDTTIIYKDEQFAQLLVSCVDSPLTNSSVLTFSVPSDQGFNDLDSSLLSITTDQITNDQLTLGAGHWQFQGYIGLKNGDVLDNHITYQFELDSSLIGTQGASDISTKSSLDDCATVFTVSTGSTSNLKVKLTSVTFTSGTFEIFDEYTSILVRYTPLI